MKKIIIQLLGGYVCLLLTMYAILAFFALVTFNAEVIFTRDFWIVTWQGITCIFVVPIILVGGVAAMFITLIGKWKNILAAGLK